MDGATEFRFVRAVVETPNVFSEMLCSGDVGWDAIALIEGVAAASQVEQLAVPWLGAVNETASPLSAPFDVVFTNGDGIVLRWANAKLSRADFEAAVFDAFDGKESGFDRDGP